MKVAVTGSTGQLGQLVIERLKQATPSENIVALARSKEKAASLAVEVREADYTKPETLLNAFKGIDKVLLISGSEVGQRATQHHNVIEAAKAAGVKQLVYTSLLHADTSILSLADEHRQTEAELKQSGLPYTILRNGWYTENYTGSISAALNGGAFIGSAGDGKIASAARADYAAAAVKVLTTEGHLNKTYELAGSRAYTLTELAAEVSRQSGKTIPYQDLSEEDYAKALQGAGLPAGLAAAIAGWDAAAAKGALDGDSEKLEALIGRPSTSLAEAVAAAL